MCTFTQVCNPFNLTCCTYVLPSYMHEAWKELIKVKGQSCLFSLAKFCGSGYFIFIVCFLNGYWSSCDSSLVSGWQWDHTI